MESRDAIITRLADEADQCRNDGADDIARLLDEAAAALRQPGAGLVAAARQAMEALEHLTGVLKAAGYATGRADAASCDLRAALAEQAAEQAEPVALTRERDARRAAQIENVELKERLARARIELMRELREQGRTPAPAAQALTDEQMRRGWSAISLHPYVDPLFIDGVRFAERAHGITAAPAEGGAA